MVVKRIVTDVDTQDISLAKKFYGNVLGLEVLMDFGFIATYGNSEKMQVQISFASQGGSNTPTPDMSIEVDDLELVLNKCREGGFAVEYGPVDEPWGVRRFFVRDPFEKLINILTHI